LQKKYGDYPLINNVHSIINDYNNISDLNETFDGNYVWIRARVHTVRGQGKSSFMLLRQGMYSVQAVLFFNENITKDMIKYANSQTKESIVDVYGKILKVPNGEEIKSATQKIVEIHIERIYNVSNANILPVQVDDCMRNDKDLASPNQDTRLDNRVIDLRAPAHIAMYRIQSAIGRYFREYLYSQDFTEIHTPKLIGTASEGGADVFKVKYFNSDVYLAQSPQLYKQMAVQADLQKVFEIGAVFRAENSNTNRHLCEFTGLDLEMEIKFNYDEVLDLIDKMFISIFDRIEEKHGIELNIINEQYNLSPIKYNKIKNLRIPYSKAIELLREDGLEIGDLDDINTENEKRLGSIIYKKYDTDFYIVYQYPSALRPFYTMPTAPCSEDTENINYSNSYDVFLRGQEIASGAQRIHDPKMLIERAEKKKVDIHKIQAYIDSFKYGSFPHGGVGFGLERVAMLYLGLENVRKLSMFPRDPKRITP
jgi:aspartyl-tRNA synthetase